MKKEQFNNKERWAVIVAVALFVCPLRTYAVESEILTPEMATEDVITAVLPTVTVDDDVISGVLPTVTGNDDVISEMLPTVIVDDDVISGVLPTITENGDVISMTLPTVMEEEKSPFDFILDPLGLLFETGAARYGGGAVEEGATLLFQNKEGEYDFSRYSDRLAVTNRSTVPALLTISAQVADLGELSMVESDDFTDSDDCSIYLAVVDDQENVYPISPDGEVTIQVEMKAAPENTYVYRLSEDLQTFHLARSENFEDMEFDTYYLGLVGACNPNADWSNISVHPVVTVTWRIDPIITEQEGIPVDEEDAAQNEDGSVSGNKPDVGSGSVSGNEPDMGSESVSGNEADKEAGLAPGNEPDAGNKADPENEADTGAELEPGNEPDLEKGAGTGNDLVLEDGVVIKDVPVAEDETAIMNTQEPQGS